MAELLDPWAERDDLRRRSSLPLRAVATVLLASGGAALRLWGHGPGARRAAVVLVLATALWQPVRHLVPSLAGRAVVATGLVASAAALTVPTVGRAPVLVVLGSLVVADAALVPWRARTARAVHHTSVAGLAVPLLVAAQVVWYRSGSVAWSAVLLCVAAAVVVARHRYPGPMAAAERGVGRALSAVGGALGALALLVVALPFFYLPAAIGRLLGFRAAGRRRRPAASHWIPATSAHAGGAVGAARLPFIPPDPRTARRRHLGALGSVVLVGLVVGAVVLATRDRGSPVDDPPGEPGGAPAAAQLDLLESVPYSARPAMAGVDHADELQADLTAAELVPHGATGYVTADTTSRHVNVRDGERRVVASECSGCPAVELWLVGASSVFGVGQRDDHTIGSELVRMGAARGFALRVSNLAAPGWTIHQEANWVRHRLDAAARPPDLVVLVDGFNDVASALGKQFGGDADDGPLVFDEDDMVEALRSSDVLDAGRFRAAVDRAASSYRLELGRLRAELSGAGIPTRAFFQPDAFASERQLDVVLGMYGGAAPSLIDSGQLGDALDATVERLAGEVVDLRHVFDHLPRPVFLDVVHTNEEGARLVAGAVLDAIIGDLERVARPD